MPIYEYQCTHCEHEFETIQKISEDPLTQCPECQRNTLRKKISAAGFRLKGGGWYETDFKGGKKRNVIGGDDKGSKSGGDAGSSDSSSSSSSSGSADSGGSSGSNNSSTSSSKPKSGGTDS